MWSMLSAARVSAGPGEASADESGVGEGAKLEAPAKFARAGGVGGTDAAGADAVGVDAAGVGAAKALVAGLDAGSLDGVALEGFEACGKD